MNRFTKIELEEALRAIDSTISKCEKANTKLKVGSSQHTLLTRRLKAFQIASSLIQESLKTTDEDGSYINEYRRLIQETNLQKGYQEFITFFRALRTYLQKQLPEYAFTGNIVENNMDYSYFQFSNDDLKSKGLKIVIVFVHTEFACQIWLSGMNREVQAKYYNEFTKKSHPYILTDNPSKTDYILKTILVEDNNYNDVESVFQTIKDKTVEVMKSMEQFWALEN